MNEFKKIFSNLNIKDIGFNSNVSVIQLQLCFRACHSHFLKVFSICAHFQQVFQLSTCAIFIKAPLLLHVGRLCPIMQHGSSINHRVGGSIPSSSCPHVEVLLSKTLNLKLFLVVRPAPCMVAHFDCSLFIKYYVPWTTGCIYNQGLDQKDTAYEGGTRTRNFKTNSGYRYNVLKSVSQKLFA